MASRARIPIFVESEICFSEMPRLRRTVAKPSTLLSSIMCQSVFGSPARKFFGQHRRIHYNITYASDKLFFYGHLPSRVRRVYVGWPGRPVAAGRLPPYSTDSTGTCGKHAGRFPRPGQPPTRARRFSPVDRKRRLVSRLPPPFEHLLGLRHQIGRASCRERGSSPGGGG